MIRELSRAEKDALKAQRRLVREEKQKTRLERLQLEPATVSDGLAAAGLPTVRLDYEAHTVRLLASSEMEREWRARSCAKEPWTVTWIEASLRGGGVLYDVGANVGVFALIAAKVCGDAGTVVAFEPGYASFAHLCDNIVLNRCQDVVIPLPLALGGTTGIGTFAYKSLEPGQSRHVFKEQAWTRVGVSASNHYHQPILSMPLDAVIETFRLPRPNHIKLDVDGGELNVLRGASATLASPELRSILIEIDDSLTEDVMTMLRNSGFVLEERHRRKSGEEHHVWYGVFRRAT
jgi:FkbM family methyltransferase